MSFSQYSVKEHRVPTSHIREYPGSTANSQEEVLELHVKQYTPRHQPDPLPTDAITLIACHGAGLPKAGQVCLKERLIRLTRPSGALRAFVG